MTASGQSLKNASYEGRRGPAASMVLLKTRDPVAKRPLQMPKQSEDHAEWKKRDNSWDKPFGIFLLKPSAVLVEKYLGVYHYELS